MPDISFWYSPGACSLAPHVLLHELGLRYTACETLVRTGATQSAEFARINPKKRVPVLSLDGEIITEVPAIATAIAGLAPERHLMGRTALEQARVYEWMNWLSGTLHGQGFGGVFRPQRFSDQPEMFDSIKAKGRQSVADGFAVIEGRLTGLHAVGDGFTAVDPYLLVFYRWGNAVGFDMTQTYPSYTRFAREIVKRESVVAALAAEGLGDQPLGRPPQQR